MVAQYCNEFAFSFLCGLGIAFLIQLEPSVLDCIWSILIAVQVAQSRKPIKEDVIKSSPISI